MNFYCRIIKLILRLIYITSVKYIELPYFDVVYLHYIIFYWLIKILIVNKLRRIGLIIDHAVQGNQN